MSWGRDVSNLPRPLPPLRESNAIKEGAENKLTEMNAPPTKICYNYCIALQYISTKK